MRFANLPKPTRERSPAVKTENILCDVSEGIATITLNRPQSRNAYTTEMGDEITEAFRRFEGDDAVRCIILTGAGNAFCAGVDLEHLKAHSEGRNASKGPRLGEEDFLRKLPLEMARSPKPILAAINGHAVGVGMTMVMPCDVRIAAHDAKLGFVFARLGILPGLGSTHLLPRLVGMAHAQELVLTGRKILGTRAAEIGLVNEALPADQVMARARAIAAEMAEIDPVVLAHAKRALYFGAEHSMAEAMTNEQEQSVVMKSERESRSKS
jgi:2-(1,2-epoxy-1,2-dihydrophenyl)acetyl-CoA isomerase